jgi:hypothetical protein
MPRTLLTQAAYTLGGFALFSVALYRVLSSRSKTVSNNRRLTFKIVGETPLAARLTPA